MPILETDFQELYKIAMKLLKEKRLKEYKEADAKLCQIAQTIMKETGETNELAIWGRLTKEIQG